MHRSLACRRRLTLIELIVVMIVLVALAGIVVSRFDGVLTQAHVAATTTNVPALESSIRAQQVLQSGDLGTGFDSLIVDPASAPAVASYLPGGGFWEALSLTADDAAALADVGITSLIAANSVGSLTDDDATFGSHDTPPIAPAAALAMRTTGEDASMLASFNMAPAPGARYLAFGIGSQCSLVGGGEGAAFSEAAVHFGDTPGTRSNVAYTRYFVVFELSAQGTPAAELRFLGVAAPHENGLERNAAHLKEFYGS